MAGLIGIAGVGAASTLRGDRKEPAVTTTSEGNVATGDPRSVNPSKEPEAPATPPVAASAVVLQSRPEPANALPAPAPVVATRPAAPRGGFVLVEGRTKLTDSIYAIRTGDSVLVNFDTQGFRTRRSDKFEATLLETLPMVFGKLATASFDTLKKGQLVTNRDLMGALATEGMRITLSNGATIRVRAVTRAAPSGTLAVAYVSVIER